MTLVSVKQQYHQHVTASRDRCKPIAFIIFSSRQMDTIRRRSIVEQIASFEKVKYFTTCRAVVLMLTLFAYLILGAIAFQRIEFEDAKQRMRSKQKVLEQIL